MRPLEQAKSQRQKVLEWLQRSGSGAVGRRAGGFMLNGIVSIWQDEKVVEIHCTTM